eukprot:TRINITY_DN24964_c0_g1_i1.p1 TRINITY_DN24964_c0_g1~~TRINITY_DN24964_c0_g1_i1.p1  ORF type:complete len:338 (-),score=75.09 TRINITY_DN24964_c0_g1_i1:242-1255(-)
MAPSTPVHNAEAVETLIFVDIDGVLNVGISDDGNPPVLLCDNNIERAVKLWEARKGGVCIEKFVAVAQRDLGHGEAGSTFSKYACTSPLEFSSILTGRLAKIITAAGDRQKCMVVLSSNWRRPKYIEKLRTLEEELSRQLSRPFTFDAMTAMQQERDAEDRLRCIGDFVADFCSERSKAAPPLKVLLLEDFFICPMKGWSCQGIKMDSCEAAENYIAGRASVMSDVQDLSVKLVHTYNEWRTDSGLKVQVGTGLTLEHYGLAVSFVSGSGYDTTLLARLNRADTGLSNATTKDCKERCNEVKREPTTRSSSKFAKMKGFGQLCAEAFGFGRGQLPVI